MSRTASSLMGLHTQTALHPGAGTALGLVDLPIQRERHTGWPTIAGSALKGILRDRCRDQVAILKANGTSDENFNLMETEEEDETLKQLQSNPASLSYADTTKILTSLFGPPTQWASEFAGALSITDARLLAFPVRSLKGVFAWVTCHAALERLKADAAMVGVETNWKPINVAEGHFSVSESCQCDHNKEFLILEEFDFSHQEDAHPEAVDTLAEWLSQHVMTSIPTERLQRQLVVLNDNDYTHFARHATEVNARIKLKYETKTVEKGALFYQEFLPAETILYSIVIANPSRARQSKEEPTELLKSLKDLILTVKDSPTVLQIGADETTGKGLCTVSFNREVIA